MTVTDTMRTYDHFTPVMADRRSWSIPAVLRRNAEFHADQPFLDVPFEGVRYTYAEMLAVAEQIGSGLRRAGLAAGDRMLIMSDNRADYVCAWFGAAVAGIVEVPLNVAYSGRFLAHQVATVGPRAAVIEAQFAQRLVDEQEACATLELVFVVDGDGQADALAALAAAGWDARPFATLREASLLEPWPEPVASDLAAVFFTSGTTGLSKGVMMAHAHVHFFAEEWAHITRLEPADTYFTCLPLFHGNAQFVTVYPALLVGARVVIEKKFSASGWVRWLREYGVTVTNLMGVMMEFLWKQPPSDDDARHHLRCVNATPTASTLEEGFKARFGVDTIIEGFGTTEISSPIATPYGEARPSGACGLAIDQWFDVALLDPVTDEPVPVGNIGELAVRPKAPWITSLGYYGMPDKTAEATRNLWFRTGDTMRQDEEGWFFFADRIKDALRRRGENISSYEVELAVLEHDSVRECAVIGVPADERGGEDEVMAIVVLAPGAELTPTDLWAFCDRRMPSFAVPRYVRFVDELPKTPTHKVEKAMLRDHGVDASTADRERVAAP